MEQTPFSYLTQSAQTPTRARGPCTHPLLTPPRRANGHAASSSRRRRAFGMAACIKRPPAPQSLHLGQRASIMSPRVSDSQVKYQATPAAAKEAKTTLAAALSARSTPGASGREKGRSRHRRATTMHGKSRSAQGGKRGGGAGRGGEAPRGCECACARMRARAARTRASVQSQSERIARKSCAVGHAQGT